MKKILLAALILSSANAEIMREVCVFGINPFGDKRQVDVCVMVPKDKIDASTKQKILRIFSLIEVESISTWKGKESAIEELNQELKIKDSYYSKLSIKYPCDK